MGKVIVKIKLTNFADKAAAQRQLIQRSEIRSLDLDVMVDTGATMLVIGEEIADALGIKKEKEIRVRLADDSIQRRFKGMGILVEWGDRDCVTDCIIMERNTQGLLGQIPLEEMDLIVDCANQKLSTNPESPEGKAVIMVK